MRKKSFLPQSPISNLQFLISNFRSTIAFCFLLFAFCLLLSSAAAQERINLNTASAAELTRLPYVGKTVAERIIEYRQKHGGFKRPQDIIIIKGLSGKRYREIAHLIRT